MTCDSRNLIYVVKCPTSKKEYIGETGIGDSKLRDRVRIYSHHIRQPEHEKRKVEKHLRIVAKETSQYFRFRLYIYIYVYIYILAFQAQIL